MGILPDTKTKLARMAIAFGNTKCVQDWMEWREVDSYWQGLLKFVFHEGCETNLKTQNHRKYVEWECGGSKCFFEYTSSLLFIVFNNF